MEVNKNRAKELVVDKEKLREISDNIRIKEDNEEMRETILALKDTMRENNLIALSAPQIGINKRIFCVKDKKGMHSFVNPMIQKSTEMTFSREKDECFPDEEYIYPRSGRVVLNYQTPMGDVQVSNVIGYSAFVFQRMIDHLNGILISDIGLQIDELWDNATEDERAEVLKAYAESIDLYAKKLNEEIAQDENLNKQMKAIEFMQAVQRGEVEVETRHVTEEEKNKIDAKLKESETDKEN